MVKGAVALCRSPVPAPSPAQPTAPRAQMSSWGSWGPRRGETQCLLNLGFCILCCAVVWRCFLNLWARCWNSPCPFSSGGKGETFIAQWKQKCAVALALRCPLSPCVVWVSSSLILWLQLQGNFCEGCGSPPCSPLCFEARITWEGQAGVVCLLFWLQFLLSAWMWVTAPRAAASPWEQFHTNLVVYCWIFIKCEQ